MGKQAEVNAMVAEKRNRYLNERITTVNPLLAATFKETGTEIVAVIQQIGSPRIQIMVTDESKFAEPVKLSLWQWVLSLWQRVRGKQPPMQINRTKLTDHLKKAGETITALLDANNLMPVARITPDGAQVNLEIKDWKKFEEEMNRKIVTPPKTLIVPK